MLELKEFKECDIDTVFKIQRAAYKSLYEKYRDDELSPYMEAKETVFNKYTRNGTKGYIFMEDGVPVGTVRILLYPETNSAKVSAIGVLPQYQGRGIAQEALLKIEKIHIDVKTWKLDTILQESGNCYLYEKIGYKKTGKMEEINERMTLVYYEKRL